MSTLLFEYLRHFSLRSLLLCQLLACICASAHKYSTPVGKAPAPPTKPTPPPSSTNVHKKYVDFDLKSQSSRYGNGDPYYYHHHGPDHKSFDHYYNHYSEHYPYYPYHEKSYDFHYLIPYVLGGFGLVVLPILTLMLTLAVNIAPASNIPTAVTTATGKLLGSLNSTQIIGDIVDRLDSAISKYGRMNDL